MFCRLHRAILLSTSNLTLHNTYVAYIATVRYHGVNAIANNFSSSIDIYTTNDLEI